MLLLQNLHKLLRRDLHFFLSLPTTTKHLALLSKVLLNSNLVMIFMLQVDLTSFCIFPSLHLLPGQFPESCKCLLFHKDETLRTSQIASLFVKSIKE